MWVTLGFGVASSVVVVVILAAPARTTDPITRNILPVEVVILPDARDGARLVADAITALVADRPDAVLGLATGSTPEPVYQELVRRQQAGAVDLSATTGFLLDEYVGLRPGHPASYRAVIDRQVIAPLGMTADRVSGPDGGAADLQAACRDYERRIAAAGGVDLQLLGLGADGHIGFNEPSSSLGSRTRLKTLTERTRHDNARFFDGDAAAVPQHVLTQGVGTILEASHIVLLAWGEAKAEAVARLVEGPITAMVPASALQLHPHATVVVDTPAASALALRDYYEAVFAAKPGWQGI